MSASAETRPPGLPRLPEPAVGASRSASAGAAVEAEDVVVRDGRAGPVAIRIYRPLPHSDPLPTLIYAPGAGSVDPDHDYAQDQIARELAASAGTAVALPDHGGRRPAGRTATLERYYAAAAWAAGRAAARGLDGRRIAVGGDGRGAGLAVALTLLARRRHRPALAAQLLLCPVLDWALATSAELETEGLPPALVITAETDAVHGDGETYAAHLRAGGVTVAAVRYLGVGTDFVRRDRVADALAADSAIAQAAGFVAGALGVASPRRPNALSPWS